MASPIEISPKNLFRQICALDAPRIYDLRIDEDVADDPHFLPAALQVNFKDTEMLRHIAQSGPAVVYCQKGRKISHGVASLINAWGGNALVLEGGQVAWSNAGLPMYQLPTDLSQTMRWVTRERPKVDRIACPWLIKRFINPDAEILFVPAQDVDLVAEKFDAIPFDTETARFSHHGTECSFDAILKEFGIKHPALNKMVQVVRAADTNRLDEIPQASGVLALLLGLSRRYKNDQAQLEAGFELCDALYFWARDAQSEQHDWPGPMASKGAVK